MAFATLANFIILQIEVIHGRATMRDSAQCAVLLLITCLSTIAFVPDPPTYINFILLIFLFLEAEIAIPAILKRIKELREKEKEEKEEVK